MLVKISTPIQMLILTFYKTLHKNRSKNRSILDCSVIISKQKKITSKKFVVDESWRLGDFLVSSPVSRKTAG